MIFGKFVVFAFISNSSLDWPLAIVLMAALLLGIWLLRPVATLLHEMGHAFPALLFTSSIVEVRVGSKAQSLESPPDTNAKDKRQTALRSLGRLHWSLSFRDSLQGFTGYDRNGMNRLSLLLVIAGGPLFSLLACALGAWLTLDLLKLPEARVCSAAFLCVNMILFVRSFVPVTLRGGEPTDGLDFLRTLQKSD